MACLQTPFAESSVHAWCPTMASTLSTMKNLLFSARSLLFELMEKYESCEMISVESPVWFNP